MDSKYYVMGLTGAKKLTNKICELLGVEECNATIKHFADGEVIVKPNITVRNKCVTIVQSTSAPVNENLVELLVAIDALKRASAKEINVILPYYGYARQDRKSSGREPITSKMVAKLIETVGATRVSIVDIHSEQTQGFFEIPVDIIPMCLYLVNKKLRNSDLKNCTIVSPDYGSVKRARNVSEYFGIPLAILDKRRPQPNVAVIVNVLGDVKGRDCIMVDDMIDTAGTMIAASEVLKKNGAKSVTIIATHGLFSDPATEKLTKAINEGMINEVVVSDTIESVHNRKIPNLKVISVSKPLAEIVKLYNHESKYNSISKILQDQLLLNEK